MHKLLAKITALAAVLLIFGTAPVFAADCTNCTNPQTTKDELLCGAGNASNNCQTPDQANKSLNDTIAGVLNVLSILVGIVAVIMIIVGAFRLITSAGKEQSITAAKQTLQYAIIGLVIVAVAQVVVRFVLHKVTTSTSGSASSSQSSGLGSSSAH